MNKTASVLAIMLASSNAWAGNYSDKPMGPSPASPSTSQATAGASASAQSASRAAAGAQATGGRASVQSSTTNNLSVATGPGSGGTNGGTRAPDIGLPSIGGGGFDCPVVGFGAGGSGLGGGGGIGPAWISPDCNARKLAAVLWDMGQRDAALAVLRDQFPVVDRAMKAGRHDDDDQAASQPVRQFTPSPWCAHASRIERLHNPASCGAQ